MTGRLPDNVKPPEVSRRAGIDLNPLSVTDDDAMAWLADWSGPSRTIGASACAWPSTWRAPTRQPCWQGIS